MPRSKAGPCGVSRISPTSSSRTSVVPERPWSAASAAQIMPTTRERPVSMAISLPIESGFSRWPSHGAVSATTTARDPLTEVTHPSAMPGSSVGRTDSNLRTAGLRGFTLRLRFPGHARFRRASLAWEPGTCRFFSKAVRASGTMDRESLNFG
jgi:hypothetical protein